MPGNIIFPPSSTAPSTFVDCFNITTGTFFPNGGGYANSTIVSKFLPVALLAGGSIGRLTLTAPTSSGSLANVYIGQVANSGNAYDFDGGQVPILFNSGSSSVTLSSGATVVSDNFTFAVTQAKAIILAYGYSGTTSAGVRRSSLGSNYVSYEYYSGNQAGTTVKTAGYTVDSGTVNIGFRLEVA